MSYELFTNAYPSVGQTQKLPQWSFISQGYTKNIQRAVTYYTTSGLSIRAGHPLLRFIATLGVPFSLPLEMFVRNVQAVALHQAALLGMTTSWAPGRPHPGHFYGPGITEYYLCSDDIGDPNDIHQNPEAHECLKVLQHPKTDMNIQYLNGGDYSAETGVAVIEFNPVILAIQVRAYIREQLAKPVELRRSVSRYLGGEILASMMRTHCEVALFNRIFNRFYGLGTGEMSIVRRHAFAQAPYTSHIDQSIDKLLKVLQTSSKRFEHLLQVLPSFTQASQLQSLQMPSVLPTRNVQWLLTLTRLKQWSFLTDVANATPGATASAANQEYYNLLFRELRRYDTWKLIDQKLEGPIYFEIQNYVSNCQSACGISLD